MQTPRPAIWIQPTDEAAAAAEPGCGVCAGAEPPVSLAGPSSAPAFSGDAQAITRVLASLRRVQEPSGERNIVDSGRIQSLVIDDGEATLTLRMGQGLCADANLLAELAFEALRQALPDTDIYLRHDRPMGCAARLQASATG